VIVRGTSTSQTGAETSQEIVVAHGAANVLGAHLREIGLQAWQASTADVEFIKPMTNKKANVQRLMVQSLSKIMV